MTYLIVDLEMSGTEAGYHDIIQIGAILADRHWNKIAEFESLVYPENPETFSKHSEDIHGIALHELDDAPMAYEVLEIFELWVKSSLKRRDSSAVRDVILCGQSVINDINFLRTAYDDMNMEWPFSFKMMDLLTVTSIFYRIFDSNGIPRPKSVSLQSVAQHFGIGRKEDFHNALEDARITYLCFREYMEISDQVTLEL